MFRMSNARPATCKVIEKMEQGLLDPMTVAKACLDYMSEDDVKDMAESEEFIDTEKE